MTLQRDTYLRELRKILASLKEVIITLTLSDFLCSVGSRVMHLAKMMERKTEALDFGQRALEFVHI